MRKCIINRVHSLLAARERWSTPDAKRKQRDFYLATYLITNQKMNKDYIRSHKSAVAIFIFLALFSLFHYMKPGFAYGNDGEFRQFGVGYRNKTVVPVWVVAIALAISSYLLVLFMCQA